MLLSIYVPDTARPVTNQDAHLKVPKHMEKASFLFK